MKNLAKEVQNGLTDEALGAAIVITAMMEAGLEWEDASRIIDEAEKISFRDPEKIEIADPWDFPGHPDYVEAHPDPEQPNG